MTCSPARLEANRRNALLSTGPRTLEGKGRSRANALKHGLTGEGIVLPDEDLPEVERRLEEFEEELSPNGGAGKFLTRRAAMLSVRLDRCFRQEAEAIAIRMHHAEAEFDRGRLAEVNHAISWIAHEPATHARKLRSMPEGIDRVVENMLALREELTLPDRRPWDWTYGDRLAHLTGKRYHDIPVSRIRALSEAIQGDFTFLRPSEGAGLDSQARSEWARERLVELIDGEIASLRALREALDPASIERDRAGAATRAIFDPSKEATLARKYEAAAERALFRALREIRDLAQAAEAGPESDPPPPEPADVESPEVVEPYSVASSLGSFFPASSGVRSGGRAEARASGRPVAGPAETPGSGPVSRPRR